MNEVAVELGCGWHTFNDAVIAYGTVLVDDPARIGEPTALGLDETLFCRDGPWRHQRWSTSIVDADVGTGRLLDVVTGRSSPEPCRVAGRSRREVVQAHRLGHVGPVGPLPVGVRHDAARRHPDSRSVSSHKLADTKLDECRHRVQNETLGHRGLKHDPLYQSRRLLTRADERLADHGRAKLLGLLDAGDPRGEVRATWHAEDVVRSLYELHDPDLAVVFVERLGRDLQDESCPVEVRSLGRTLIRWKRQIAAWHRAHLSNGPTEGANNLIKRIKRVGSAYGGSATTGSGSCSTPDDPTGTYSPPSRPVEIRRAVHLTDDPVVAASRPDEAIAWCIEEESGPELRRLAKAALRDEPGTPNTDARG